MKLTKAGMAFLLSIVCSPFFVKSQSTSGQPRLIIPFGHQMGILHTLFSHENNMLITADEKMTIVSDVRSGKPLFYLQGTRPVISANDNFIATIVDSVVMVWNTNDGLLANSLRFPSKVAHIAFHPVTDLLMVERLAGEAGDGDQPQFYHAAIWDVKQKVVQHAFDHAGSDRCQACQGNDCPIAAAWFTNNGDSVRIVHPGIIKTYALNNYKSGPDVCLTTNDKDDAAAMRILNNHIIGLYGKQSTIFFNEYGQQVGHWTKKASNEGPSREVAECISPNYEYLASYTSESIYLYNLKAQTLKYYNADRGHVKKLTFNRTGSHILVEFLNEAPRIMTSGFIVPKSFKPADYEGFPKYVYETKTEHEASDFTDGFRTAAAGAKAQKPRRTFVGRALTAGFGVPNPYSMADGVMGIMVDGINIAFTNSGEIIDLATRRPISKIQSLIKMSGDVRLSPDKNLLLLNTGKLLSVYSIPGCKVLVNLRAFYLDNVFSPDSRWLVQHTAGASMNLVNLSTGLMDTIPLNLPARPSNPAAFMFSSTVSFTADSRRVIIGSGEDGSVIVDIETKKIVHRTKNRNYYSSADGLKYGVIDHKEHMAYIHSTKDSSRLYSFPLPVNSASKSSNDANDKSSSKGNKNKKDKKNAEPAEEQYAVPCQISFGQSSNAFAIWCGTWLLFVKDINKPADTVLIDGDIPFISRVTISANNNYLNIKPQTGNNIILNVRSKATFQPIAEKKEIGFNIAGMLRNALSGNLESILRSRDMAQFSVTGDSVLTCNEDVGCIYDCATGKKLHTFKADGEIKYFSVANNLAVSNYYGQLKFYTLRDMKAWLSMIPFTNGEMVYLLPNGIYSGSKSATRYMGYMQDAKSLSYKQFDYNNNRPDIVMRALGNTDATQLALYDTIMAMRRRREEFREVVSSVTAKAPKVSIINEKDITGEVKQKVLSLQLSIKTFQQQYPDKLAVYVNGNPMGGPKGIRLSRKGFSIDTTVQVSLTQGKNNIEVSVFDASGAESFRQPLYVQYTPDSMVDRKLYFMGIGVSRYQQPGHNLDYAQKDVKDVLDSLRKQYGQQLVEETFFNEQATLENLRKLKSKFSKTRPDDIVIIYYSGHGIMDGNRAEAFFGTYDVDFMNPSKLGISIDDFNNLLAYIPSRNKVIFLDACHSGEINKEVRLRKPGDTDPFDLVLDLFTDHYQGNGTNIIVAARGEETGKECKDIQLGVFTYTVLKGLAAMTADEDSNAVLTIGELQNYITRNVIDNSTKCWPKVVQRAGIRKENEYNDWAVLRNGSATFGLRCTITETTQPRPLVNVLKDTRDSVNHYVNQGRILIDRNSSIEERVTAFTGIVKGKLSTLGKRKDNATWLQQYRTQKKKQYKPLANEDNFIVKYEKVTREKVDYIIFDVTSKYVIPSLRVDINDNKEVDACIDKVFTRADNNAIQVQYMLPGEACTAQALQSGAAVYATADQYLFMVPVAELSSTSGHAQVNFILYSNMGKEPVSWPAVSANKLFENYYNVEW